MDRHIAPEKVASYIASLVADRATLIRRLQELLDRHLPYGFAEDFQYGMITWVVPKSRYPAGYHASPELPLPFISIASQKRHIAIYHLGLYADPGLLRWFSEGLVARGLRPDIGKSCIRLDPKKPIPWELIGALCEKVSVDAFISLYESSRIVK
jgi:hypothetical protein